MASQLNGYREIYSHEPVVQQIGKDIVELFFDEVRAQKKQVYFKMKDNNIWVRFRLEFMDTWEIAVVIPDWFVKDGSEDEVFETFTEVYAFDVRKIIKHILIKDVELFLEGLSYETA